MNYSSSLVRKPTQKPTLIIESDSDESKQSEDKFSLKPSIIKSTD